MFSGQGSQYYHMGKELYENHAQFKLWMDHCDKIVQPHIQISLIDILYSGRKKSESFDHLLYTNPALLCIEYSLVRVLMEMGVQPDFLLGYSLGEITASVVSGAISLEEGIEVVVGMARLAEENTPQVEMLAVIESLEITTEFPDLFKNCWVTGKNFQRSFVVSGLSSDIRNLQEGLNKMNLISQKLPVKYGFHTELIDPIESEFNQMISKLNISSIGIPMISSLKNETLHEISKNYFWEVIRYPVDFMKTIEWMLKKGDYIFIDVGPSGTLATFVKYILSSDSRSISLQMINQFGNDLKAIEKLGISLSEEALV